MKSRSNRCSGCRYFLKLKQIKGSSGICEYHDARCDSGFTCDNWKGIKFKRKRVKVGVDYD